MIHKATLFCLGLLILSGVFVDTEEVKSVSVTEGDSVTLNTDVTEIQSKDQILWMFGHKETRIAEIHKKIIDMFDSNVTFGNRLRMDNQTGSLTIRNINSEHTGLYKLQISNHGGTTYKRFNVTVYADLPIPVITSKCSPPSSGSSVSNCSLLCSAVNVSHVTLSWYKGNSLLSSISVSDLSISLSLPLEVEYQDNNTYICVINNAITNHTKHLDISQHCHTCTEQDQRSRFLALIVVAVVVLMLVTAMLAFVRCYCFMKCKQAEEVKTQEEEMHYTEATFHADQFQTTDIVAADHIVYSSVKT